MSISKFVRLLAFILISNTIFSSTLMLLQVFLIFSTCMLLKGTLLRFRFLQQKRRSHQEVFCKNGVLKNFAKFTGKHLYQSIF